MRRFSRVSVVVAVTLCTASFVWALTITPKFPHKAKGATAVVDEDGNVVFGSAQPGKIEVTNLPSASVPLAAMKGSDTLLLANTGTSATCTALDGVTTGEPLDTRRTDKQDFPGFAIPAQSILVLDGVYAGSAGPVELFIKGGQAIWEVNPGSQLLPNIVVKAGDTVCASGANLTMFLHAFLAPDA